jgi:cytochrome c
MKNYLGLCIIGLLLAACGGTQTSQESENENATTESTDLKGQQLIASSDCYSCHKEQEKLIGPAYKEVAAKYENSAENVTKLADKIINGGKGVWGEIPMTAHPQINQQDAEEMVKYILTLK